MILKYKISSVLTEYLIHVHNDNFIPAAGVALQSTTFCRLMDNGRLATMTTVNRNTTPKMRKTR